MGLRRNLLMTLATVITVAVSLAVFGAGILLEAQVRKARELLYAGVEVSMFLEDDVSQQQTNSILADLEANGVVHSVIFESKLQAYENAKKIFANDPELIEAIRPETMPASFRVKLSDPERFEVISSQFEGYPGINEVVDQRELLSPFFTFMNKLRTGAFIMSLLQMVAAAALISNTIRLTAFARREQTAIMKLVGATNWYIRLPFMVEGMVAGLIGGVIAGAVLLSGDMVVLAGVKRQVSWFPFLTTNEVAASLPLLIVSGTVIAGLASVVALRRFLDV